MRFYFSDVTLLATRSFQFIDGALSENKEDNHRNDGNHTQRGNDQTNDQSPVWFFVVAIVVGPASFAAAHTCRCVACAVARAFNVARATWAQRQFARASSKSWVAEARTVRVIAHAFSFASAVVWAQHTGAIFVSKAFVANAVCSLYWYLSASSLT